MDSKHIRLLESHYIQLKSSNMSPWEVNYESRYATCLLGAFVGAWALREPDGDLFIELR